MSNQLSDRTKNQIKYPIKPIESQSQSQGQTEGVCNSVLLNLEEYTKVEPHQLSIKKQLLTKTKKKLIKKSKKRQRKNKERKNASADKIDVKFVVRWNLPLECSSLLIKDKGQFWKQLQKKLRDVVQKRERGGGLMIEGRHGTGKKTILFKCLQDLKQKGMNIESSYLDFSNALLEQNSKKISLLWNILNNIQTSQLMNALEHEQDFASQKCKGKAYHLIVINDSHSFAAHCKRNTSFDLNRIISKLPISFIFVDSRLQSNVLNQICNTLQTINCPDNSTNFFSQNLTAAIKHYHYKHQTWTISRPLANYLSKQLQKRSQLNLALVYHLISFLEEIALRQGFKRDKVQIVNGGVIQQFLVMVSGQVAEVNIKSVNVHEKCAIIGCFVYLNETEELLIENSKLYKIYDWICKSLSITSKEREQFVKDVLGQLVTYNFLRCHKLKVSNGLKEGLLCLIDLDDIRNAYQKDLLFGKFFHQKQSQSQSEPQQ